MVGLVGMWVVIIFFGGWPCLEKRLSLGDGIFKYNFGADIGWGFDASAGLSGEQA